MKLADVHAVPTGNGIVEVGAFEQSGGAASGELDVVDQMIVEVREDAFDAGGNGFGGVFGCASADDGDEGDGERDDKGARGDPSDAGMKMERDIEQAGQRPCAEEDGGPGRCHTRGFMDPDPASDPGQFRLEVERCHVVARPQY
jgi:hypothetical protein